MLDFELGVDSIEIIGFTAADLRLKQLADGSGVVAIFNATNQIMIEDYARADLKDLADWDFTL